jgi:alkylation response protein AidB-like acyl-CoA dehydrogenase
MDLTLSEEQQAISDLAARILTEQLPPERLRAIEESDSWFAPAVWSELAKADLLGIGLPEDVGGGGYGLFGACLVAQQVGRAAAPLPFVASVVSAAPAIAEDGSPSQRDAWLPGVIDGSTILSAALTELGDHGMPTIPSTQAIARGDGWELRGEKAFVPAADRAARILVPARTSEHEVAVFLVDPAAPGVTLTTEIAISREPLFTVQLDGVAVGSDDIIGSPADGRRIAAAMADRTIAAMCWTALGVCEAALALTAAYVSEREQFGTKIGTFQAVAHRCADAYMDTEAIRLTSWQAAWRLDSGLPADEALAVAKFWAAEGGQRVVHAAQHLHGGIGVDVDYPLHRYFRWAKVVELTLGGAAVSLVKLGDVLAQQPVEV